MFCSNYVFTDRFMVPCDLETAWRYITRIEDYSTWWTGVYKQVETLKHVPEDAPGGIYWVKVGGFLPYYLMITNEVVAVEKYHRIDFIASGDLEGKGSWLFRQVAGGTEITWDWRVAANKKVIRWLSFLLKPLFRANHAFCVQKARNGMKKDLMLKAASNSL